jgi:hypothetical protein
LAYILVFLRRQQNNLARCSMVIWIDLSLFSNCWANLENIPTCIVSTGAGEYSGTDIKKRHED